VYERLTENLLDALAHQLPVNLRRRLVGPPGNGNRWPSTQGDAGATRSSQESYLWVRIERCAKSFILQVYDVLARHNLFSDHCRDAAPPLFVDRGNFR